MFSPRRKLIWFAGLIVGWSAAASYFAAALSAATGELERFSLPAPANSNICAYPSLARLHDDRLLCVFSAYDASRDGKIMLAGVVSTDHGHTWSSPQVLIDSLDGNDYDPSIVVIGPRVIVTATTTPLHDPAITTSRTAAVRSEDGGRSWSAPYEIPTGRRYTSGKVNNGIVTRDGTALLGFTWEKNLESGKYEQLVDEGQMEEVNAVLMSFDEGRTWAASESVELAARRPADVTGAINGVCEPALVECDDGSIYMLSRTGLTNLYGCRSIDGGRSWSPPEPTTLVGHNAPAALCQFSGDRPGILVAWNNSPRDRWPLCVAESFDGCRTWSDPRVIEPLEGVESSYPSCVQAGDGKLLVVYQQSRPGGRDIRGVRLDPAWDVAERPFETAPSSSATQPNPHSERASAPQKLQHFSAMPKPAVLPDGTWAAYFIDHEGPGLAPTPDKQSVYAQYSSDHGRSWSDRQPILELPPQAGGFGYFVVLVDQDGEVHLWMLCDADTGAVRPRPTSSGQPPAEPLARQRLDIWHVKSVEGRKRWSTPKRIWEGRAGDLQSVVQLNNGRILLPICYYVDRSWSNRGEGPAAFTYCGQFDTTALFSDDRGESWQVSPSTLRTATPDLSSYGAVEPVVLELNDGRVWMLLRTQLGRFYESFSDDGGSHWSPAQPSAIPSSDSPAALARLPDKRILLLWNNCQRHPYAQGSRHVLHGAVSADEGRTWHGYREIVRDPHRDAPPPTGGDHGVSYPFIAVVPDGTVLLSLWVETGEGRDLWRLDPHWLDETSTRDDFSNDLAVWSTFGTQGVTCVAHPDRPDAKVMSLVKSEADWPAAAVWNFPGGRSGRLRAQLLVDAGAPALEIQLTDHFSPPFDEQSGLHSVFRLPLATCKSADRIEVPANRWVDLDLQWDCDQRWCRVTLDGRQYNSLVQQRESCGPSYLRISLDGASTSPARVLVSSVEVDVSTLD